MSQQVMPLNEKFLFQKVNPNLKLSVEVEEEVPVVFKRLGYPFQISMSALYAAGSPYTWPGLLAALVWLIHLLLHQEATESVVTFETQVRDPFSKTLASHINASWRETMMSVNAWTARFVNSLRIVLSRLRRNCLQWHKQAAEKKLEARKGDLVDKKAEKTVIQADIEELHNRIASQEINPADIDRMQKEKDFLDANTRPVVLKDQQLRKAAWDHELASTNKEKDLEILCGEYNERCLRFKPILADGQPLTGSELQITLQIESTVPKEILGTSVANGLKQAIFEVMESCKRYTNQEKKLFRVNRKYMHTKLLVKRSSTCCLDSSPPSRNRRLFTKRVKKSGIWLVR
nr:kinetochore protein NDC80 homolog [Physcomitrium patens]|eukprot:XP_024389802.1 kinetochore protein NDC80 homolog [Physcomitrella patens]